MKTFLLLFSLGWIVLFILEVSCALKIRKIHRDIEGPLPGTLPKITNQYVMRHLTQYEPYESSHSVQLRGSTDQGYYYATVFVGSPPQKQTVIVDTGSSVTAIPCKQCTNCGKSHSDPYYNPESSDTASYLNCNQSTGNFQCKKCGKDDKCKFSVTYTEGSSLYGEYVKDTIAFGDDYEELFTNSTQRNVRQLSEKYHREKHQAVFGCTSSETGLFFTQEADGILGLGRRSNSSRHPPNFMDFLSESKDNIGNSFSLCLAEEGGYMTIGGLNPDHHHAEMKMSFIPLKQGDQYYVDLTNIFVEDMDLKFTKEELTLPKGVFFDSGSTMTHVPPHIRQRVVRYLESYCQACPQSCGSHYREDQCYSRDLQEWPQLKDFFDTFPDIKFEFGNHLYTWRPQQYLYKPSSDKEEYCLALFDYPDRIILGASFMKYHDIYFDKTNRMVGFIESDCLRSGSGSSSHFERPPKLCSSPHLRYEMTLQVMEISEIRNYFIVAGLFLGSATIFYSILRYRRYRLKRKSGPTIPMSRNNNGGVNVVGVDTLAINNPIPMFSGAKAMKSQVSTLNHLNESSEHPPKGQFKRSHDEKVIIPGSKSTLDPDYNYQISEDDDDHLGQVEATYADMKHENHRFDTGHNESHHVMDNRVKVTSLNNSAAF